MKKLFYLDVETTGLDAIINDIIQLSFIIEIDGEVKETHDIKVQPFRYENISDGALDINGTTVDMLKTYIEPRDAYKKLVAILAKYVNKFDRTDKYQVAAYNARFDMEFLKQFFIKNGDVYFGSFFNYKSIDPLQVLYFLDGIGEISLKNYKLETACDHFGIEINAHDALSDIQATRELIGIMTEKFIKKKQQRRGQQ